MLMEQIGIDTQIIQNLILAILFSYYLSVSVS